MIDFYLLPLGGADEPLVTDYEKLSMKFVWEGKLIHLEGESDNLASAISPKQLQHLALTNSVASLVQRTLWAICILQNLLLQFHLLFSLSYLNFKSCSVNLINYLLHDP